MAQHVVEVAGDTLPLGDGGQPFDLLVRPSQLCVLTLALSEKEVCPARGKDQERHPAADHEPVRNIEQGQLEDHRQRQDDEKRNGVARCEHQRRERGRVEHVRYRRHVQRHDGRPQHDHQPEIHQRSPWTGFAPAQEVPVEVREDHE